MSSGYVLGVIVLKVFTEFLALKVLCLRQHYCFEGKFQSCCFEGIGSVTERARAQPGRKLSYAASCLVGSQIFAPLLSSFLVRPKIFAMLPFLLLVHRSLLVEMLQCWPKDAWSCVDS